MKLSVISLFLALSLLATLSPKSAFADGSLYGRVYMEYQGRQIPLKGVFIKKIVDCNRLGDKNQCQDKSCLGNGFCPSIPQSYYTKDDGIYEIKGEGTLIKNDQPATCGDGGIIAGCGIDCGLGMHQFIPYFPSNYNQNLPAGVDFRKGHFEVATPISELTGSSITTSSDALGNQFYNFPSLNNQSNNPNLDFKWVPDPLPIAGIVVDSQTGNGISGVGIEVVNDRQPRVRLTTTTDSQGKFSVDSKDLLRNTTRYAVRIISAPASYEFDTRIVTTTMWSWINVPTGRNASPPDQSYELQDINNNDCSGPEKDPGKFPPQTGRCNFKLDPKPVTDRTPGASGRPGTSGTPGIPGSQGVGTTNPDGSINTGIPGSQGVGTTNPDGSINPPSPATGGTTDPNIARCINIPASGNITGISINNKVLALNNATSLALELKGFSGQSNFIVPVVISYSNNACRVSSLIFRYNPRTSRPSPKPEDCAKTNGRPDDCACVSDNQCSGGKCDPNRKSCSSLPFIQTQGGDVHSNIQVNQ